MLLIGYPRRPSPYGCRCSDVISTSETLHRYIDIPSARIRQWKTFDYKITWIFMSFLDLIFEEGWRYCCLAVEIASRPGNYQHRHDDEAGHVRVTMESLAALADRYWPTFDRKSSPLAGHNSVYYSVVIIFLRVFDSRCSIRSTCSTSWFGPWKWTHSRSQLSAIFWS